MTKSGGSLSTAMRSLSNAAPSSTDVAKATARNLDQVSPPTTGHPSPAAAAAATAPVAPVAPQYTTTTALPRWEAANTILRLMAGGAATGALGRAAIGLRDMLSSNSVPYSVAPLQNSIPIVEDPIEAVKPRSQRKKRKRKKSAAEIASQLRVKSANKTPAPAPRTLPPVEVPYPGFTPEKHFGSFEGKLTKMVHGGSQLDKGDGILGGFSPKTKYEVPALYAMGIPLGLGAAYAGFKGVDYIADKLRSRERERELETAKRIYQEELANLAQKQASDSEFRALDELGDAFEKLAFSPTEVANTTLSAYLPLAALLAIGGGLIGHQYGKKRSERETLEDALEHRAQRRMFGMPITASPDSFYLDETL